MSKSPFFRLLAGLALVSSSAAFAGEVSAAADCVADPASASALLSAKEAPDARPPICLYTPDQPARASLNSFNFARPKAFGGTPEDASAPPRQANLQSVSVSVY